MIREEFCEDLRVGKHKQRPTLANTITKKIDVVKQLWHSNDEKIISEPAIIYPEHSADFGSLQPSSVRIRHVSHGQLTRLCCNRTVSLFNFTLWGEPDQYLLQPPGQVISQPRSWSFKQITKHMWALPRAHARTHTNHQWDLPHLVFLSMDFDSFATGMESV